MRVGPEPIKPGRFSPRFDGFEFLTLSLVEICFIYPLKVGQGGRLSMSVRNSRLQIVNGLPYSPKTKAKGTLLVRGPWDETPSGSEIGGSVPVRAVCL